MKVTVLDMQPIEPATGGGRLRLLGLYHALGPDVKTLYVGTYDWRGPAYRRQMLSPTLEELLIPLSEAHFSAADARSRENGGRVVIDSTFPELAHLSPDYIAGARNATSEADVVVFSHPWIYPLVRDLLDRTRQLVVYDAHNVEGLLRMELLDDGGAGTEIVRNVIRVERELCLEADLVVTCSHEDRSAFNRLYGIPFERMRVFPNGTFTEKITPATGAQKAATRAALKLGVSPVAFFIGSNYAPNVQAARFIANYLCPALPHMLFVIAGGVCDSFAESQTPFNMRIAGSISEEEKLSWLRATDIALNPMFGGSGTNIKMLDYMAAGLPIVTTHVGARGLDMPTPTIFRAEVGDFVSRLSEIASDSHRLAPAIKAMRGGVLAGYSWEALSPLLGAVLAGHFQSIGRRPFFSVIVPLKPHHPARSALRGLAAQTFRNFEVILVGGSAHPNGPDRIADLPVLPIDVPSASQYDACNAGANASSGSVIAFLEPDDVPDRRWLENARSRFRSGHVAVLQGCFGKDDRLEPETGCWGENTFVKSEIFHSLGGFRRQFTPDDLVWHAQSHGFVTAASDVLVYQEAAPRDFRANPAREPKKMGWVSTWKVPCGIAEYSRNFLRGLETVHDVGCPVMIFCDTRTMAESEETRIVVPCWTLGTHDTKQLAKAILREPLQSLIVQHHPGLLPWPALCKLLDDAQLQHLEICVMLHNTQELVAMRPAVQTKTVVALRRANHIFVHTLADYERLTQLGLAVRVIPHGVSETRIVQPARQLDSSSAPTIGCFGFFFPHKRIHLLIEAFAEVRKNWPKSCLRLVNAAFPREDSRNEIARCRELVANLHLTDSVEWITEFVAEPEAIRLLSQCDVIILPYAITPESASGAIRIALASGTPVAATSVAIFDEAEGAVARLDESSPSGLAKSISEILADHDLRARLQTAAVGWTVVRTWDRMASRLTDVLSTETGEHFGGTSADPRARYVAQMAVGALPSRASQTGTLRQQYSA